MPPKCKTNFMGQRADGRKAVALAVDFAERHPRIRAQRRASAIASLIATCAATQFNPNRCAVPVTIPFRHTIPTHQPQYALGRVETLLRAGYYNAGSCIRALNLEYEGTGLTWNIQVNDFFVACTAARKHPFGIFPARLVMDAVVTNPQARRHAVQRGHVVRNNAVESARVRVPLDLATVGSETVTAREMCQLARVFGMRMYAPSDQIGPTRVAFFSHVKSVPREFAAQGWREFDVTTSAAKKSLLR